MKKTEDLTDSQARVLDALHEMLKERGYPPTLDEIGTRLNLRSKSTVKEHLVALEDKGYIKRIPGSPRAIEILKGK